MDLHISVFTENEQEASLKCFFLCILFFFFQNVEIKWVFKEYFDNES